MTHETPAQDQLRQAWKAYRINYERFGDEWLGRGSDIDVEFDRLIEAVHRELEPSIEHTCAECKHDSDCSLHNEPAMPNRACDCSVQNAGPSTEETDMDALIEEALSEPTFGPASDHDACQYWANLARKLAHEINETLDTIHGETGL